MINLEANERYKQLGCKWNGSEWVGSDLAKEEMQAIKDRYYSDLVVVKITVKDVLAGGDMGYSHARLIAGYVVATASGRDSGARISEGVAIVKGNAKSGGSVKNYVCVIDEDTEIKLKVSRNVLSILEKEAEEGRYTFQVLESGLSLEDLKIQREELLRKLNEIDIKISTINC